MKKNKLILAVLVGVVVLGVVAFSYQSKTPSGGANSQTVEQNQVGKINLIFDFDSQKEYFEVSVSGKENLFDLVLGTNLEIKTEDFPPFGKMIVSINGFKNGEGGKYWQYLVNGKYAEVGASDYIPKPGDSIEWQYTGDKIE